MGANRSLTTQLSLQMAINHLDFTRLSQPGDRITWPDGLVGKDGPGNPLLNLLFGTGVGKCNLVYHDHRHVWHGVDWELDLGDGSLIDKFGGHLVFTCIKLLVVYNHDLAYPVNVLGTCAGGDQIISMTSVGAEAIVVPPKHFLILGGPDTDWGVTAGVRDRLHLDSGTHDVDVDIIIVGDGTRAEDEPTTTFAPTTTTTAAPTTTT